MSDNVPVTDSTRPSVPWTTITRGDSPETVVGVRCSHCEGRGFCGSTPCPSCLGARIVHTDAEFQRLVRAHQQALARVRELEAQLQSAPEPTAEAAYRSPRTRAAVAADQVANAFGNCTGQLPEAAGLGPTAEELRDPEAGGRSVLHVGSIRKGRPHIPPDEPTAEAPVTLAELRAIVVETMREDWAEVRKRLTALEARDCTARAEVEELALQVRTIMFMCGVHSDDVEEQRLREGATGGGDRERRDLRV